MVLTHLLSAIGLYYEQHGTGSWYIDIPVPDFQLTVSLSHRILESRRKKSAGIAQGQVSNGGGQSWFNAGTKRKRIQLATVYDNLNLELGFNLIQGGSPYQLTAQHVRFIGFWGFIRTSAYALLILRLNNVQVRTIVEYLRAAAPHLCPSCSKIEFRALYTS
jgi:hypothetical protein